MICRACQDGQHQAPCSEPCDCHICYPAARSDYGWPMLGRPRGAHRATRRGLFRVFRYIDPFAAIALAVGLVVIAAIATFGH